MAQERLDCLMWEFLSRETNVGKNLKETWLKIKFYICFDFPGNVAYSKTVNGSGVIKVADANKVVDGNPKPGWNEFKKQIELIN